MAYIKRERGGKMGNMKRSLVLSVVAFSALAWGIANAYAAKPVHDVAVTEISAPGQADEGDLVAVSVTVENQGNRGETFTLSLTDETDAVLIDAQQVSLDAGNSTIVPFDWDTAGSSLGDHNLKAEAEIVPGETDIVDNSM